MGVLLAVKVDLDVPAEAGDAGAEGAVDVAPVGGEELVGNAGAAEDGGVGVDGDVGVAGGVVGGRR